MTINPLISEIGDQSMAKNLCFLIAIDFYRLSSIIIDCHQLSSIVTDFHIFGHGFWGCKKIMQLPLKFRFSKTKAVLLTPFGGDPVDRDHRSPSAHCRDLLSASERRITHQFQRQKANGQNSSRHISCAKAVAIDPGNRTRPRAELTRVVVQAGLLIDN